MERYLDSKIRGVNIHYQTHTEKKWMLIFVWDKTKTRLSNCFMSKKRPRQDPSCCVFLWDGDKKWHQRLYIWLNSAENYTSWFRMKPRQDWVKLMQTRRDRDQIFHPRQDRNKTRSKILTKSLCTFSFETKTKPRLSSFAAKHVSEAISVGICSAYMFSLILILGFQVS